MEVELIMVDKTMLWKFVYKEICRCYGTVLLPRSFFLRFRKRFNYFWDKQMEKKDGD